MHGLDLVGRCIAAGADRPHRLVGDDDRRQVVSGNPGERPEDLLGDDRLGPPRLPLLERFPDADDRRQPRGEDRFDLGVDRRVGLPEQRPPLRVPQNAVAAADVAEHAGGHLAGEGPAFLVVGILATEFHPRRRFPRGQAEGRGHGRGVERRRAEDEVDAARL